MVRVEQGDLLNISGLKYPVIVVSNAYFNRSGKAVVCPISNTAAEGPLHIPIRDSQIQGYILCEQVHYIDLSLRHFSKLSATPYFDIMDISDAVISIFDYQQK